MPANISYYRARDLVGTPQSRERGEYHRLPFSPATLWRLVRRGDFPPPVKFSANVAAWPVDAVESWVRSRGQR